MEDTRTSQHDGSDQYSKKAATSDKPILTNDDDDHIPAPAPHVGGNPPQATRTFTRFLIDAGGEQWASAKYPVDVQEVR